MENTGITNRSAVIGTVLMIINLSILMLKVNGQIFSSSCTPSMLNSFTPCLNYITGSSGNGTTSPTADCCNAFKSVLEDGVDCACLIVTGNVPISLPLNPSLAINLPRACKSALPLQCKASGVPLPAPGPVLFGPSPAPVSASQLSPRASKVSANSPASFETAPAPAPAPAPSPTAAITHRRSRPAVIRSASSRLYISFPPIVLMLLSILIC